MPRRQQRSTGLRPKHRRRRHHNWLPGLQSLFVIGDAAGNPPSNHSPVPFLDEYLADYASRTHGVALPHRVRRLLNRHTAATSRRNLDYQAWKERTHDLANSTDHARERHASARRTRDQGTEL